MLGKAAGDRRTQKALRAKKQLLKAFMHGGMGICVFVMSAGRR